MYIATKTNTLGRFDHVEVLTDRLIADGTHFQLSILGEYHLVEDADYTPPPDPKPVPASVSMRQARLALLKTGKLTTVNAAIANMAGAEGDAARIEWEFSNEVLRNQPLVMALAPVLNMTAAQLDQLFILAAGL